MNSAVGSVSVLNMQQQPMTRADDLRRVACAENKWSRVAAFEDTKIRGEYWDKRLSAVSSIVLQNSEIMLNGPHTWADAKPCLRLRPSRKPSSLRFALRHHKFVTEAMDQWWSCLARSCVPIGVDGPEMCEALAFVPFIQLNLRLRKALFPPPFDVEDARRAAEHDWVATCPRGSKVISRHLISAFLFDIADGWCTSTTGDEYGAFLKRLFRAVTSGSPPSLSKLAAVAHTTIAESIHETRPKMAAEERQRAEEARQLQVTHGLAVTHAPPKSGRDAKTATETPRSRLCSTARATVRKLTKPRPFSFDVQLTREPVEKGASTAALAEWRAELDTVHRHHRDLLALERWKGGIGIWLVSTEQADGKARPPAFARGAHLPNLALSLSSNKRPVDERTLGIDFSLLPSPRRSVPVPKEILPDGQMSTAEATPASAPDTQSTCSPVAAPVASAAPLDLPAARIQMPSTAKTPLMCEPPLSVGVQRTNPRTNESTCLMEEAAVARSTPAKKPAPKGARMTATESQAPSDRMNGGVFLAPNEDMGGSEGGSSEDGRTREHGDAVSCSEAVGDQQMRWPSYKPAHAELKARRATEAALTGLYQATDDERRRVLSAGGDRLCDGSVRGATSKTSMQPHPLDRTSATGPCVLQ